jgi:hypothetical protein
MDTNFHSFIFETFLLLNQPALLNLFAYFRCFQFCLLFLRNLVIHLLEDQLVGYISELLLDLNELQCTLFA